MKKLLLTWTGLMLLLAATTASALMPLGNLNALLNIVFAVAKAVLVILFFMHLRHSIALLRLFALVSVVILSLLFILSGADFVTRTIQRSAWQSGQPSASAQSTRHGTADTR